MAPSFNEFFASTVEPTVAEFVESPLDVRRGRLAALVLYHMADHYALEGYTGHERRIMDERVEQIRQDMLALCADFKFIRDIADATKHARLSVSKRIARELSSSEQLTASPGLFQAPFGEGVFAEAAIVFAALDDGSSKPLLPAVRAVLDAWRAKL